MFVLIIVNTENYLSLSLLVAVTITNNSSTTIIVQNSIKELLFSLEKDSFVINSNAHVSHYLTKQGKCNIQFDEVEIIFV